MNLIGEWFFWYRYRLQCDRGLKAVSHYVRFARAGGAGGAGGAGVTALKAMLQFLMQMKVAACKYFV